MQPLVRIASEADLVPLMELIQLKADFDGWPDAFVATYNQIREAFFSPTPRMHAILAEVKGNAVGIATYYPTFSTLEARPGIWLDDLYVREEFRSRGIGTLLLAHLAQHASETNCGRIEWTVALSNERGIAFYERIGATVRHLSRCVRVADETIQRLAEGAR